MAADRFIPVIRGAISDVGDRHALTWQARALLLWLTVEVADRRTGVADHMSVNAISEASRCSWRAVRRTLDELEAAGLVKTELRRGHPGRITLLCGADLVDQYDPRSRGSTGGSRGSTGGSRASSQRSRASSGARPRNGRSDQAKRPPQDIDNNNVSGDDSSQGSSSPDTSHRDGCTCSRCRYGTNATKITTEPGQRPLTEPVDPGATDPEFTDLDVPAAGEPARCTDLPVDLDCDGVWHVEPSGYATPCPRRQAA